MAAVPPRSTEIHCGSLDWLLHRVVVRPSNAAAGALPPSHEDAFTGMNCEMTGPVTPPVPPPPPVVKTWNSHSEYPNPVARAVPYRRTYRPGPFPWTSRWPPVPPAGAVRG